MISSKDISASQGLKCSLDIFFLLEIFQTNSVVAALEVHLVYSFIMFFADLRMSLGLLEYFDFEFCLIFHILSFKYFEESFEAFFTLQILMLAQSLEPFACLFSN